jgi:protein-L-isoaspartate O-methyltransferase
MSLIELPLPANQLEIPPRGHRLILDGLTRSRQINCFDFVPCSYGVFYNALANLPPGTFCEWGSGMGIATALAELLGFDAHGIEIDQNLAAIARQLLAEHGFRATIRTGDYLQIEHPADVYFVYCWPGQMEPVKQRFEQIAPSGARLLIAYGAEDIRCLIRPDGDE